ncbi:hypothetical protein HPB48_009087 [Haemaphysalis longicornis]|uniref:MICAL-like protein 1 n=1 Tax=Haemaphysalis longicornis TaxID=44386 RepID=A0A9J6FQS0_HAELO|nr:hypothetical protein HPB48_009087 [Haemaphysalis longicornis]
MGERRGLKALELWCRRVTEGYRDVNVVDMSSSWRDGLAFCALIHHFRPDLIEFEALRKGDVLANNRLAFSVAESQLGIPALLDAEDMLAYREPDRLSVATYVSQFYQYFEGIVGPASFGTDTRCVSSSSSCFGNGEDSLSLSCESPGPLIGYISVGSRAGSRSAMQLFEGTSTGPCLCCAQIRVPFVCRRAQPTLWLGRLRSRLAQEGLGSGVGPEEARRLGVFTGRCGAKHWAADEVQTHSCARERWCTREMEVSGLGDTSCHSCRNRVFLLERLIVDGRLYHRSCFRCSRCDAILNPGAYNECDNAPGTYECTVCPKSAMVADGVTQQPTSTTNGAAEYTPGSTPMMTPDTTPDMTPDGTPQMTPSAARKPTTAKPWETSNSGVAAAVADDAAKNGSEDAKTKDVDSSRLDDTAAQGTTGGDSAVAKWKSIQKPELPSFLRSRDEPRTTSTVRENIKRFSQVPADGATSTSPFRLRRSVRDDKENNAASPLRGSDRFFSSRLSSEKGAKLGGSATDLVVSAGGASPELRKQRSRQEEASPGPESPTTERLSLKLPGAKDQTSPGRSPSPRKASLDMPVIKSDISAQDLIPKPLPRTRTLKPGLTGSYSLSVMSSTFGSNDEMRGRAETDGALSDSPPPLPSEPPPSLASDDGFPEEMSEKAKLAEEAPKLDREHAVVSRERSPAPKDRDSLSLSRKPRDSISPNRTATSIAPPGLDGAVPESVAPTKPSIPAVQLPSEAQDPEPPDKEQSAYPTDLNPFGSDSEEEDEPEYPESLNPFNDELEDDEEAAGSQAASSPARKSSLYDDSLNPFSEEDDERDMSLSGTTSPSKRTPSQAKKSEGDVSARRDKSEKDEVNKSIRKSDQEASPTPSKNTFGYWKRKKRPAPSVPVPIKRIPLKEIQLEMESITAKQEELERQGREIEMQIRDRNGKYPLDGHSVVARRRWLAQNVASVFTDCGTSCVSLRHTPTSVQEEMIMQLFELVNEKNNLFRRQAELMYM